MSCDREHMEGEARTVYVVRPKRMRQQWQYSFVGAASEDEAGQREEVIRAEEGEEFGERKMKKMQDPVKPSPEEVEEHNKLHLPYRSWCRHCVRGRGRSMPHCVSKEQG